MKNNRKFFFLFFPLPIHNFLHFHQYFSQQLSLDPHKNFSRFDEWKQTKFFFDESFEESEELIFDRINSILVSLLNFCFLVWGLWQTFASLRFSCNFIPKHERKRFRLSFQSCPKLNWSFCFNKIFFYPINNAILLAFKPATSKLLWKWISSFSYFVVFTAKNCHQQRNFIIQINFIARHTKKLWCSNERNFNYDLNLLKLFSHISHVTRSTFSLSTLVPWKIHRSLYGRQITTTSWHKCCKN